MRTIHSAPNWVFVAIGADFADGILMGDSERIIEEIETQLKAISPALSSIYNRPEKKRDRRPP